MEACRRTGGSGATLPERGFRPLTDRQQATGTDDGAPETDGGWVT